DPFPYTGATISCEALWMGVPFTTLRGDRPAGRVGATLLTRVGLPELIADTPDQLVTLTVELARDVPRLTALRADLRPRMRDTFLKRVADILERRRLTNDGPYVRAFEERVAAVAGVRHCVATCNGTMALQIAGRALGLTGAVIVPSFTFVATAHALQWQGVT